MRKSRPLAAGLAALALTLSLTPVQAAKTTYSDVDGQAWYSAPVAFCQRHGLMDGASQEAFQPEERLTRAVLAEALYRLEGSPAVEDAPAVEDSPVEEDSPAVENSPAEEDSPVEVGIPAGEGEEELPFSDVGADHPNLAAIRWAKENEVVGGYPDGAFRPEGPITREEIAVLLWSSQGRQTPVAAPPCGDEGDISDWARDAVAWAYETGLMSGNPDGRFLPRGTTTRAEGAAIITSYAKTCYGLTAGYTLPEEKPIPANPYRDEDFHVDERGYLSYSGGFYAPGVDVSAHQKEIDWARVAASGMRFAMIRAGYRGYVTGKIVKDDYFSANMRGALANGMDVGVYFFSQAITPAEAEEEARQLLEWMEGYQVTYPVVFDWEEQDKENSRTRDTDGNTVTACALAFCQIISDAGYQPMTYGSPSKIYKGGLSLGHLQDYGFWLAHYTKDTVPTDFRYHYDMWQYTSTGYVDGIDGRTDLDISLVDWSGSGRQNGPPAWLGVE